MLCSDASSVGVEWSGGIYYTGEWSSIGRRVLRGIYDDLEVLWEIRRLSDIRSLGDILGFWDGFSQQGWLRGPRPFLDDTQSLRCCNLLRVPDKVTDRKNRSGTRGASSVRCQGTGRRHGSRLEPGDRKRLVALTWQKTESRRTKAYDVTVYDKSEHK